MLMMQDCNALDGVREKQAAADKAAGIRFLTEQEQAAVKAGDAAMVSTVSAGEYKTQVIHGTIERVGSDHDGQKVVWFIPAGRKSRFGDHTHADQLVRRLETEDEILEKQQLESYLEELENKAWDEEDLDEYEVELLKEHGRYHG